MPDWGRIFTEFACHTNISRQALMRMSLPQIQAYRDNLGDNIAIKLGLPGLSGDTEASGNDGPPKLSDFMTLASSFDGI